MTHIESERTVELFNVPGFQTPGMQHGNRVLLVVTLVVVERPLYFECKPVNQRRAHLTHLQLIGTSLDMSCKIQNTVADEQQDAAVCVLVEQRHTAPVGIEQRGDIAER